MTSGTVINQDVVYGTKVSSGTTVTVVLSKGPEPTTAAPTTPAETKPAETTPAETKPPETTPPETTTAEEETPTTTE
jgi:serine/threonine-protein kinase